MSKKCFRPFNTELLILHNCAKPWNAVHMTWSRNVVKGKLSFLIWSRDTFVCLFVWSFSSHSRIFQSFGDITIAGEGLPILTYAQHLWPSSSSGWLACHTYCDTGHLFIMVIFEDPWHSHLMPSVCQWNCHYLSRLGFEHPTFRLRGECSNPLRHRRVKLAL